ncbi:MAG: AsmA family protein [Planctomycetota bacterium]|nr:MAG: AsmA family protein [Planctomycetota bacterium]
MKKPLKILYIILSAVVLLLIVAVIAVTLFAGAAVKIGVETAGTKALSVPVALGDVDLSIFGGRLGLQNLVIDNPPGYQHDKLLKLKDGRVAVDIRSLLTDTVNVKEIKLDGINLVLEQKDITQNNLHDIIKAIPKGEPKAEEPAEKPGKKLRIDNLEITNVTVEAKLPPIPGKPDTVTLKLDPITMTDLGDDEKLDTAILVGKVLLAIEAGVAEQGAGVLPDEMMDAMKETWSRAVTEKGKKLIEEGKDVLEDFKGLFKKKEEQ